jgi:hypothetical protein
VDCSKLSDERLPVLKGKMKDWFDEACWHAPSLIVLDNLDRLIGAEVEVSRLLPCRSMGAHSDHDQFSTRIHSLRFIWRIHF